MFNQEKFKATVLYIMDRAGVDKTDIQKINIILWLSDIVSCDDNGCSISGETYIKKANYPEAQHLISVLEELDVNYTSILKDDTAYIDTAIEYYKNIDTEDIYNFVPVRLWEALSVGEEIPVDVAASAKYVNNDIDVDWDRID